MAGRQHRVAVAFLDPQHRQTGIPHHHPHPQTHTRTHPKRKKGKKDPKGTPAGGDESKPSAKQLYGREYDADTGLHVQTWQPTPSSSRPPAAEPSRVQLGESELRGALLFVHGYGVTGNKIGPHAKTYTDRNIKVQI